MAIPAADWQARLGELALSTGVPGASLAIWADGREMLAAFGVLSTATQVAVTPETVFQIGSITKVWTASMIMQLIDEGKLSLDSAVAEILPDLQRTARDAGAEVRIRHLLTHTSGIDGDIFARWLLSSGPLCQPSGQLYPDDRFRLMSTLQP